MEKRSHWTRRLESAWAKHNVVWLMGVRRAGKTTLCASLPAVRVIDCERPSARRELADPEAFLEAARGQRVCLDEIHRLDNPSEILKLAADHYRDVRVVATGSSTLTASAKFRDALTGRKAEVWLTPMMSVDLVDFDDTDLAHRFLHGGLPPFFLDAQFSETDYQEWLDSYWAKDVLELFRLERRASFLKFVELLLARSGGIFEATWYARPCEVSRQTIQNYLAVLEATHVAHIIRPFSSRRQSEIVSAPKVYGFDTGFICFARGYTQLPPDDMGPLWEHWVLNEFHAQVPGARLQYWRDKSHHEIDFVWLRRGRTPIAIECKWSKDAFDGNSMAAFRQLYPHGENWLVASDVKDTTERASGATTLKIMNIKGFADACAKLAGK